MGRFWPLPPALVTDMVVLRFLRFLNSAWKALGSINLTIALCLLLAADLLWGYVCINWRSAIFIPLNDMGLFPWIQTYGRHNPAHTTWFFLLLLLLALLALNTASCTLERVRQLWAARASFSPARLLIKLGPQVMHAALLVILLGYLASYLFTEVSSTVLLPGRSHSLPGQAGTIVFTGFTHETYQGKRLELFHGEVIQPRAGLLLQKNGQTRQALLGFNRPVRLGGYSVHLDNFAPKKPGGGMRLKERIDLHIRKDPGVFLYLTGIALFCLGLALYVLGQRMYREAR